VVPRRIGVERVETPEGLSLRRLLLAVILPCCALGPAATAQNGARLSEQAEHEAGAELVWHVEDGSGEVVDSRHADLAINPASTIKAATSLWALDRLGPEHRFETRFAVRGSWDRKSATLSGDLIVIGGADPDFHLENAQLVAEQLRQVGLLRVTGSLLVDDRFWIGWEGGSERRERDTTRRAEVMARRLQRAWDPTLWSLAERKAMDDACDRRGCDSADRPRIVIAGGVGRLTGPPPANVVAVHRSNPLIVVLRRFNAYSNNDIERLAVLLGSPDDLASFVAQRLGGMKPQPVIETLSGLGSNRLSPRQIVRILRELRDTCSKLGLRIDDVLPAAGCVPGTLKQFPRLSDGSLHGALVAKTGTLTTTDGGVAVLGGFAATRQGELLFCVAAPGSGDDLGEARREEQRWVLDLFAGHNGARPQDCRPPLEYSDHDASVTTRDE